MNNAPDRPAVGQESEADLARNAVSRRRPFLLPGVPPGPQGGGFYLLLLSLLWREVCLLDVVVCLSFFLRCVCVSWSRGMEYGFMLLWSCYYAACCQHDRTVAGVASVLLLLGRVLAWLLIGLLSLSLLLWLLLSLSFDYFHHHRHRHLRFYYHHCH